jgi:hypothetical protein
MELFACEAGQKARGDSPRARQSHVVAPASPSRRQRNASPIEFLVRNFVVVKLISAHLGKPNRVRKVKVEVSGGRSRVDPPPEKQKTRQG